MSRKIVVGSRESRLAIIQTEKVMEHIRRRDRAGNDDDGDNRR